MEVCLRHHLGMNVGLVEVAAALTSFASGIITIGTGKTGAKNRVQTQITHQSHAMTTESAPNKKMERTGDSVGFFPVRESPSCLPPVSRRSSLTLGRNL